MSLIEAINSRKLDMLGRANPGRINWKEISILIPARTETECFARHRQLLNSELIKGAFSPAEDEVILKLRSENMTFESIGRYLRRPGKRCSERCARLLNNQSIAHQQLQAECKRGGRNFGGEE
eukprot:gene4295-8536_t